MASHILHPEEWQSLVRRIKDGDPEVGAALVMREQLFDNFFDWFDYVPEVRQPIATPIAVTTSIARVTRLGQLVFINGAVITSGTGTANQPVNITLPVDLPPSSALYGGAAGGSGYWNHGGTVYSGAPIMVGPTATLPPAVQFFRDNTAGLVWGQSPNASVGAGPDGFAFGIFYITAVGGLL